MENWQNDFKIMSIKHINQRFPCGILCLRHSECNAFMLVEDHSETKCEIGTVDSKIARSDITNGDEVIDAYINQELRGTTSNRTYLYL